MNTGSITPLMRAAHAGNVDLVALLLKAGARVDAVDYRGDTALGHAIQDEDHPCRHSVRVKNQIAIIDMLLKKGAALESQKTENAPLYIAVVNANVPVVRYCLARGENPNINPTPGFDLLMRVVMQHCKADSIKSGRSPCPPDMTGHDASRNCDAYKEIARYLLAYGAKVDTVYKQSGQSALFCAILDMDSAMVRLLVSHGVNVEYTPADGELAGLKALDLVNHLATPDGVPDEWFENFYKAPMRDALANHEQLAKEGQSDKVSILEKEKAESEILEIMPPMSEIPSIISDYLTPREDVTGEAEIMHALHMGDAAKLQAHKAALVSDVRYEDGDTILHLAIRCYAINRNIEILRMVVRALRQCDYEDVFNDLQRALEQTNGAGMTPRMLAKELEVLGTLEELINEPLESVAATPATTQPTPTQG